MWITIHMKCQVLFSLKNKISFRLVCYNLRCALWINYCPNIDNSWPLDHEYMYMYINLLKYKAIDK